jgi:hypothetical protein
MNAFRTGSIKMASVIAGLILVLLATAANTAVARPITGACLTSPDTAAFLVSEARSLVRYSSGDAADLAKSGLVPVDTADIALETADSVCAAAVAAFNLVKPGTGITEAYVVRVGTDRYMIWDMRNPTAHWRELMIFDGAWNLKARFAA